ncbi:MAG TPA: DNA-formamidopyrimidine glycosylase family protein [Solirubrobacterales bacterium]|nr:DNA-formamidopyrimidine glycosylase family protein [Solirubrobacterales bacterium]
MPELPEVEIVARRLDAALRGAEVESVLAPGMNVMKTFEPPLEALVGRELTGVRRIGKMPVVEFGPAGGAEGSELSLLIHLMSAGRLRVFDKRASLKDRASRVLVRLGDGRELRLREFGTKQRAWAKLLPAAAVAEEEMVSSLGPEAWPAPPLERFAALIDQPRHLHPLLRHQKDIAGIGRSWVDEILWEAMLSPFKKGSELSEEEVERLHAALHVLGDAIDHYEETIGPEVAGQGADAAAGAQARGGAVSALRDDDRGGLLQRVPDELLPERADRRPRAERPPALEVAEVGVGGGLVGATAGRLRRDLPQPLHETPRWAPAAN